MRTKQPKMAPWRLLSVLTWWILDYPAHFVERGKKSAVIITGSRRDQMNKLRTTFKKHLKHDWHADYECNCTHARAMLFRNLCREPC